MMNLELPKISVVTPNYNRGDFLEKTILSVLEQKYPNLEYILIDGGSTDESVSIIKKYQNQIHHWVSEKDDGMYYAINKGFSMATGDIMCWINSDDILWENALHCVAKLFEANKNLHWLQGYPTVIDKDGVIIYQRDPVATVNHFIDKSYIKTHHFIQQESTFWSRELWDRTEGIDTSFNLAADFDLWMQFFRKTNLYCSHRVLGAFRKREGQQSENMDTYIKETKKSLHKYFKSFSMIEKIKQKLVKHRTSINWID